MTLEQIYARIPSVNCQRKCQEACGPIPMEPLEYSRIFNRKPNPSELFDGLPLIVNPVTGACPKLSREGECRVYDNRPAICRLFGTIHAMACPFGCQPERWLTDKQAREILKAVESLSADSV